MKHHVTINENNKIQYEAETEDVIYLQSCVPYTNFNVQGCNILEEQDNLDYTLIQDISVFIIVSLDEYSISFISLLINRFPKKKIICLDNNARKIWTDSEVFYEKDSSLLGQHLQGKSLYIYSTEMHEEESMKDIPNVTLVYSSLQVMQSLCWARKKTILGERNSDKTILLIEFSGRNAGMGDIIISAQQYIRLARQRGWYPVVNLTEDNQYISHEGDNMWDYYFQQPGEISVKEALESQHVIRGRDNHFGVLPWVGNPICNMQDALKEKVFLKEDILKLFSKDMPKQFLETGKVLGVIARGSDLAKSTNLKIDISKMIDEVRKTFDQGYEYLFLATEDSEYHKLFCKEFGEKLLYIHQKRVNHDYEREDYQYVADLLDVREEERTAWGLKYLLITYCLSQCNALLYSIPCGALRLADLWRNEPFEFVRCTFQAVNALKMKTQEKMIHIYECEAFFKNHQTIVIYGLGDVAQMIYPILDKYREKIIACDKRAAFENYDFHGIEVIAPEKLSALTDEMKILITSPRCGEEIQMELEQMGIAKECIVRLDY